MKARATWVVMVVAMLTASCATPPDPILATDVVKTQADAIRIAIAACGNSLVPDTKSPANWIAYLKGGIWTASYKNMLFVDVLKNDGKTDGCIAVVKD